MLSPEGPLALERCESETDYESGLQTEKWEACVKDCACV